MESPVTQIDESVQGLHRLDQMVEGTAMPRLNAEEIENLIHCDTRANLGLS